MLRSIKQLYGAKLGATDGEIGHVKDFYFDDTHWAIRYVVADTGSWLHGRLVLISPHAFTALPEKGKPLGVNLTQKQLENSPPIETHKPVSRQYEEEYYRYYGWPYYWQGGAPWGMSAFPIATENLQTRVDDPPTKSGRGARTADSHLRSAQAITGYQIQTQDEVFGHVTDFMIDERSWVICHLVINTGNRFAGTKVLLSPSQIDRISWEESKVFVNVGKDSILQRPASDARLANPNGDG